LVLVLQSSLKKDDIETDIEELGKNYKRFLMQNIWSRDLTLASRTTGKIC
jgi:hypothetical protein